MAGGVLEGLDGPDDPVFGVPDLACREKEPLPSLKSWKKELRLPAALDDLLW
jgi:hypothetical protein